MTSDIGTHFTKLANPNFYSSTSSQKFSLLTVQVSYTLINTLNVHLPKHQGHRKSTSTKLPRLHRCRPPLSQHFSPRREPGQTAATSMGQNAFSFVSLYKCLHNVTNGCGNATTYILTLFLLLNRSFLSIQASLRSLSVSNISR